MNTLNHHIAQIAQERRHQAERRAAIYRLVRGRRAQRSYSNR